MKSYEVRGKEKGGEGEMQAARGNASFEMGQYVRKLKNISN